MTWGTLSDDKTEKREREIENEKKKQSNHQTKQIQKRLPKPVLCRTSINVDLRSFAVLLN